MSRYDKPEVVQYGTVESMTEYHKDGTKFDEHDTTDNRTSSM